MIAFQNIYIYIYNDFDFIPLELLQDIFSEEIFFFRKESVCSRICISVLATQIAIDHAVFEADKTEPALYQYLSFDTELLDVKSNANDE